MNPKLKFTEEIDAENLLKMVYGNLFEMNTLTLKDPNLKNAMSRTKATATGTKAILDIERHEVKMAKERLVGDAKILPRKRKGN